MLMLTPKHAFTLSLSALLLGQTRADTTTSTSTSTSTVSSIQNDLTYDENNKLASYHLVYPANNPNCPAFNHSIQYQNMAKSALEGDALKLVFPDYNANDSHCVAACLERGADHSNAGHALPHKHWSNAKGNLTFNKWFEESCSSVEVCLMNYLDKDRLLEVYYLNRQTGGQTKVQTLGYGDRHTKCFNSYLGHSFQVRFANHNANDNDNGEGEGDEPNPVIEEFSIDYPLVKAFGESPPHGDVIVPGQFDQQIKSTLRGEWNRHNIPKRTFSPLGFAKGRLPPDVFASMGAFFYNNRRNKVREEWRSRGVFVNWWEADVFFIQIPWNMKTIWQSRLVDLVSEWAGTPVEQTVMYGLRQYESGARLISHVDRLPTHAVSLIVNIAQGDLTQDWPVEVFDHENRLHEVTMEPGDIVYYESAKNLHSRNRPLMGEHAYYVNLFTHYRPVGGGDQWHEMPSDVDPLLAVEGGCTVPEEVTAGGKDQEYLGYGRVKCDDLRLGKNVSPSLFQAKGPEDMVEWWSRTSPDVVEYDIEEGVGDAGADAGAGADAAVEVDGDDDDDAGWYDGVDRPRFDYYDDDDDGVYDDEEDSEVDGGGDEL